MQEFVKKVEYQQTLLGSKPGLENLPQHVNFVYTNQYVGFRSDKVQVTLEEVTARVYQLEDIDRLEDYKGNAKKYASRIREPGYPVNLTINRIQGVLETEGVWEFRKSRPFYRVQFGQMDTAKIVNFTLRDDG